MDGNLTRVKLTQTVADITGKKWCGYHRGFSAVADGKEIIRRGTRVFMCGNCCKRREPKT